MGGDRQVILDRLLLDIIGPQFGSEEQIDENPTERYLTGILFPRNILVNEDEQGESDEPETANSSQNSDEDRGVSLFRSMRPPTAGISFAVENSSGDVPEILIEVECGKYCLKEKESSKKTKKERGKGIKNQRK